MIKQLKDCLTHPEQFFSTVQIYTPFHCIKSKDYTFHCSQIDNLLSYFYKSCRYIILRALNVISLF